jgi:hypothetical protein
VVWGSFRAGCGDLHFDSRGSFPKGEIHHHVWYFPFWPLVLERAVWFRKASAGISLESLENSNPQSWGWISALYLLIVVTEEHSPRTAGSEFSPEKFEFLGTLDQGHISD